jgi:DNA modification methylase
MGRRFIGIEQDPEYFQSAVERIRAATAQGDMFLGQNIVLGQTTHDTTQPK